MGTWPTTVTTRTTGRTPTTGPRATGTITADAGTATPSPPDADRRLLAMALGLLLAFMAAEVVVACAAGSLALLSDAAHMLTDAGALALLAMRLAARPAAGALTFGLKRAEILSRS